MILKNCIFQKFIFFQNCFLLLWFVWPQKSKIVPRPEFCPARRHKKKGCAICWQYCFCLVCSAILAQLSYRYCGAIYCTSATQQHEVDDHRGNWLWWPPLATFAAQAQHFWWSSPNLNLMITNRSRRVMDEGSGSNPN